MLWFVKRELPQKVLQQRNVKNLHLQLRNLQQRNVKNLHLQLRNLQQQSVKRGLLRRNLQSDLNKLCFLVIFSKK